jgi:ABC-type lipoprotein release transport system permease subunit
MSPVVYVPFRRVDAKGAVAARRSGTFLIRTSAANPASLAPELRRELTRARPELRVREVLTQMQIDQWHTARERLLARLALFFGMLALILAGVGLYGVLDYSVLQRRREIGIRMAIGARAVDIVRRVTAEAFALVFLGTLAGIGIGMASVRYVETLLYGVKATDAGMVVVPCVAILAVALVAALPAVMRAVRLDPVKMLRE